MSFSKDFTTSFVKGLGKTVGVVTIFSTIGLLYNFYLFFNQKKFIKDELIEITQTENVQTENVQSAENDNFEDKRRVVFTESEIEEHDLYYGDLHRSRASALQDDQNENVSFKMLFDRIK